MSFEKDPLGFAISDFINKEETPDIIVHSDLCDDDTMPVPYLFRTFENMPPIEKKALSLCKGLVLDVGAGAGCHTLHLKNQNFAVKAIDTSHGVIEYLKSTKIDCDCIDFLSYKSSKFDTILMLMNGIGIAGDLESLEPFLHHAKSLMKPGGQILCDSTDISYMYIDDEGAKWMDLASNYYGEMQFQMTYKTAKTDWFPWLYIDFKTLETKAKNVGLKAEMIVDSENDQFLAKLTEI
ncbi:MAG: class I SAM-dependent methyltransferase [Crocinitomicaceae bacterium]